MQFALTMLAIMSLTGGPKTSVSSQIDGKMYPSSAVSVSVVKDFATALVLGSDPSGGLEIENELPATSLARLRPTSVSAELSTFLFTSSVKAATDFTMSSIPS